MSISEGGGASVREREEGKQGGVWDTRCPVLLVRLREM
jgi:hypothetical protein